MTTVSPERMTRIEHYFKVAEAVSTLGECRRTKVGAVIVADDRIWATGRNGTAPGATESCLNGDCPRGLLSHDELPSKAPFIGEGGVRCIARHAEWNARDQFIQIARMMSGGRSFVGEPRWALKLRFKAQPILYVTHTPCMSCANMLNTDGIQVLYPEIFAPKEDGHGPQEGTTGGVPEGTGFREAFRTPGVSTSGIAGVPQDLRPGVYGVQYGGQGAWSYVGPMAPDVPEGSHHQD